MVEHWFLKSRIPSIVSTVAEVASVNVFSMVYETFNTQSISMHSFNWGWKMQTI